MTDPIVEEIHKIRAEYAAKFNYDVDAMFEDIKKNQAKSLHKIVSFVKNDSPKQENDKDRKAA